ncbi:MAG: hypothetical protein Q4B06_00230 [Candidatus Saccharibacteria bacterium]|nr:hypothetical protein [Candidatus Saccharibacteria bacterium]
MELILELIRLSPYILGALIVALQITAYLAKGSRSKKLLLASIITTILFFISLAASARLLVIGG